MVEDEEEEEEEEEEWIRQMWGTEAFLSPELASGEEALWQGLASCPTR